MTPGRLASASGALLLLPSLWAAGLLGGAFTPATPAEWLTVSLHLTALLTLVSGLAGEAPPRARLTAALASALAALPFLCVAAVHARGAVGTPLPGPGFAFVPAAVLVGCASSAASRHLAVAALLTVLGTDLALAQAQAPLLPAAANPLRQPLAWVGSALEGPGEAPPEPAGPRPGAYVAPPPGAPLPVVGEGPWWAVAQRGDLPRAGPVVRVLGGAPRGATARQPLERGGEATLVGDGPPPDDPAALSAYDALVLLPGAAAVFDATPEPGLAERRARSVADWTRRGGLLIGVGPEPGWPAALGQALGRAAREAAPGVGGAAPLGLGHVARAQDEAAVLALLGSAALWPPTGTALDGLADPPRPPDAFGPWRDEPASRRGAVAVLAACVLALGALGASLRGPGTLLRALALPVAAAAVGAPLLAPPAAPLRAYALALDLGGAGGRRVEALWLSVGERGYAGRVGFTGAGAVRWIGQARSIAAERGDPGPPRVLLEPGTTHWLVRHTTARGPVEAEPEERGNGWLRALLRGPVDDARLRYARGGPLPCVLEGFEPPPTATLSVR